MAPVQTVAFEESARDTLQRLRLALSEVVAELDGVYLHDGMAMTEFARHLGIDNKLAWKMGKVILTSDPFEAAQSLPGAAGLDIFLKAAGRRGARPEPVERARAAFEAYRRLIRVHAGNKASFESMVARLADDGSRTDLEQRKAAFRSNTYLFGVQARVQLRADFLAPTVGGRPGWTDVASVRGFIDLVRTRANVEWPLGRLVYRDDHSRPAASRREPIDPDGYANVADDGGRVPLLRAFCSSPLPTIIAATGDGGEPDALLEPGAVGKTGAITCLIGEVGRDHSPAHRTSDSSYTGMAVRCYTPCEMLVIDRYAHRSLFGGRVDISAHAVSELYRRATGDEEFDRDLLPLRERVAYLGMGPDAAASPLLPRQRELAVHVCERLGWNAEDFLVYRLAIEYPVVPSCLFLRHDMPEAKEAGFGS